MRFHKAFFAVIFFAAFFAAFFSAQTAFAQSRVDVEKARAAYLSRNYAEAEERLRRLVDPAQGLKEISLLSQARMYLGAVLLAQGKRDAGIVVFEKMIAEDASYEPDPLGFPSDVINTFFDVRSQMQEKIRLSAQNAARLEAERRARAEYEKRNQEIWLAKIKTMASEEVITVRHSRVVAFLPFGAGQFQNGKPALGWTALGLEAACVIASGMTVPMYTYARGRAEEEARTGDLERKAQVYQTRAEEIRTANLAFAGAFIALAAIGIVQANVAFAAETVEVKKRPLPSPSARVTPFVWPLRSESRSEAPVTGFVAGVSAVTF